MNNKPNIVFILTDDQRFDTIRALGNKEIETPNLDELVKMGITFTQAHIPGGTSAAICMPSRAMIHSGRQLFSLQDEGQEIPKEHITLGENLRRNGYYTYGIGKWHNGCEAYNRSFDGGKNIFFGGMWDHWNVPICEYDETGKYEKVIEYTKDFSFSNKTFKVKADKIRAGKHSTDLMCEAATDFIKNYGQVKPFFMYISFLAPHDPRTMPEEFKKKYHPSEIEVPSNFKPIHEPDYGIRDMRDEKLEIYPRTGGNIKKHIADYYAMITHLDGAIGDIIMGLKEKGIYENTLIVFAGDNGLAIGRHGLMGKQNLYEHSIRVPLILIGPGVPRNERRNQYTYLMDIYPTICDLIGVGIPESVEGKSLLPILEDNQKEIRKELYLAYTDKIRGIKDEKYKFIAYRTEEMQYNQLFDLEEDPDETNNLWRDRKGLIEEKMIIKLLDYKESWKDERHKLGEAYWKLFNL